MNLAIFDVDGTLTDTVGVDEEIYCETVAEALGLPVAAFDWRAAAHVTDTGIFHWLCEVHELPPPSPEKIAWARHRFVERIRAEIARNTMRFGAVAGAREILDHLRDAGWHIAVATGGWGPSARLKLETAGITIAEALIACADDALTRPEIVTLARARARTFYDRDFERVVSIGDGTWDVACAATLQMPFVGIGSGERASRLRDAGARAVVPDYRDITAFMDALTGALPPVG
jgi:phosphoglycolate phosphatase-like HAD superfamily hydrolase